MKFESKFGLGEIVIYNEHRVKTAREMDETFVKIVGVLFELNGDTCYICEYIAPAGIQRITLSEAMLTGDPDFNQETGYKAEDLDG